jgi:uncharacterized protein
MKERPAIDQAKKRESSVQLFEAVMAKDVQQISRLLKAGTDVNQTDADGFSALMLAVARGDTRVADCLLDHHASVNARNDIGQTALMIATQGGKKHIVRQSRS